MRFALGDRRRREEHMEQRSPQNSTKENRSAADSVAGAAPNHRLEKILLTADYKCSTMPLTSVVTMPLNTPSISDAEWDVMKIVWDSGPLTSGQIVQALEPERHWKPRTIKTLLARLVKKGAVAAKEDDNRFRYSAKVAREAVIRRESRSFISRVFDGAAAPALVHILQDARLSREEIEQLQRIL